MVTTFMSCVSDIEEIGLANMLGRWCLASLFSNSSGFDTKSKEAIASWFRIKTQEEWIIAATPLNFYWFLISCLFLPYLSVNLHKRTRTRANGLIGHVRFKPSEMNDWACLAWRVYSLVLHVMEMYNLSLKTNQTSRDQVENWNCFSSTFLPGECECLVLHTANFSLLTSK